MSKTNKILHENTPLSPEDCLYIIQRRKREFTYPIHTHMDFELNYVENASRSLRVVGNSSCEITNYDLVLITNGNLAHAWQTHECTSEDIREITIQFAPDLLNETILSKKQFQSIKVMFERARHGLAFPLSTILRVRSLLTALTVEEQGFYSHINFMALMYELSQCTEAVELSSSSYTPVAEQRDSEKMRQIDTFVQKNYNSKLSLEDVAEHFNMTPVSLSRFFKVNFDKSFTDFITEIRVGYVIRMLVDTNMTVAEICSQCGFNNISNFNRVFKKREGCTPQEFREAYKKKRIIF